MTGWMKESEFRGARATRRFGDGRRAPARQSTKPIMDVVRSI